MASKRIAGITGELILNVNKWSSGIKQAQKDADALQSSLKPLSRAADTIGKPMLAAGLAISAGLGAAAKVAADYGDQLSEVSSKTGITTQDLGKLKFAAEQNDTSFEGLSGGLKILSKNLIDASTGGKENAKVFKALGISTKDAQGNVRPLNDVLLQSADIFKRLPDGPEKAAIAMKLFGKSGADLIPLLNQGSAGIKEFGDEAERLGLAIDPATAALGDDFNNALNKSKNALLGFSVSIGNVLLPALTSTVNKGNEVLVWASNFAREFPVATKAAAGLAGILTAGGGLIVGLGTLGTIAPKVAEGLKLIGGSATLAKAGLIGLAIGGVLFLKNELDKLEDSGMFAGGFWEDMREGAIRVAGPYALAKTAIQGFREAWEQLTGKSRSMDDALKNVSTGFQKQIDAAAKTATATQEVSKETDKYSAELRKMLEGLNKTTKGVDEHTNKVKQLNEAFIQSLKPADDLQKTLSLLNKEFATQENIVKVYGAQIIETVESQKAMGRQVSALMANYYGLAKAQEDAIASDKEFQDLLNERSKRMEQWNKTLEDSKKELSEWVSPTKIDDTGMSAMRDGLKGVTAEIDRSKQVGLEGIVTLGKMRGSIGEVTDKIDGMRKAGRSDAEIIAVLDGEMRSAEATAKKLGVALDPTIIKLLNQADAADRAAARAKNLQDSWGRAMSNMVRQTAHSLADMIIDWDFKMDSLTSIAKNTAKDMLGSFIEGFFQPFADRMEGLGRKAGDWAANIVFGTQQQQQQQAGGGGGGGGILNNLFGGILGGGSGGGTYGGTPPFVPGETGGMPTGNMGGGGLLDILGGWLNKGNGQQSVQATGQGSGTGGRPLKIGPVEVDPVGLYKSITGAVGGGRKAANEIVKAENAFFESVKKLLEDTTLSVTSKSKLFENTLSGLQQSSTLFAGSDKNTQKVVNQMFANLAPFISNVRSGFEREMPTITPGAGGTGTLNASITIAPVFNFDGSTLTPLEVKDQVIPVITSELESGVRGTLEKWSQLLSVRSPGTFAPHGI